MLTNLQTRLKAASRWLPVALLPLLPVAANAQTLGYSGINAVNTTTTYADLGSAGTAISTLSNDDANSAAQPIGFTFTYNGTAFTQFILNTNGLIKLGSTAPSRAALYYENFSGGAGVDPLGAGAGAADINLIMPFNFDLVQGTSPAEYRVATTGTSPNQVCTIQWKNVSDKSEPGTGAASQYANFSFQAKLYENGNIEFVYGPATASAATAAVRFPNVGLKGSNTNANQVALALKGVPSDPWSATTFISQNYGLQTHNINKVGLPDPGRTYRFVPGVAAAPANDNCSGATALTVGSSCTNVAVNNLAATASTGAPALTATGCFNPALVIDSDLWYTVVVPTTGTVTVTTSAATGSAVDDTGILIYSGTCAALTEIGCNDAISTSTEFSSATVTGRTPGSILYVRVFTYPGTNAGAFNICATTPAPNDAAVRTVYTLTKLPIPQGTPHTVRAYVTNSGTTAKTGLVVTLNVTGANTFTSTRTVASLAVGASTLVTFDPYVPTTTGTNSVTVSVPADDNTANNSVSVPQVVQASDYSYAEPTGPASGLGFGPSTTSTNAFLAKFTASTSINVTQVRAALISAAASSTQDVTVGKTVYAVVINPTTGAVLGRSPNFVVTAANVTGGYTTFTLNTPVSLPAGDFMVGLAQTYQAGQTIRYFPMGVQPEIPTRTGTFYTTSITTPAVPVDVTAGTAPFDSRFMLEAVTVSTSAPACTPITSIASSAITQNGATITFTAPTGTTGYVVTYTAANGTPVTITPAPTGSPIVLTGLNSGTTYTVSVVTSCSAGANSIPVTTTFTTLLPAPTYATLPLTESFEGTWLSVASLRDAPTASWRNTPATGDNSWRRDDDGVSANWQYLPDDTNPAAHVYDRRFSTGAHSARFHTYGSISGGQGKLDLYVNLSGTAGSRVLDFDYINPTGADNLQVLVSTDGGATFGAALLTATTNATFTAKTVVIPSTSATTVVRFQATADNLGDDDIGLDNVRLSIITATRNEALAATVGLYPNPAHQRFTVQVPAGSLQAATATLTNTLGQTVLTKQLALPAAGGTADFDVSRLAAGVYSLQLKSGNDLVVKRVVVE
jgi:hypothetical protein